MSNNNAIAKRLMSLREKAKKNQEEMAQSLGITQSYWSYVESGEKELSKKLAFKIEEKYGVSLNWLFKGEEDMTKNHIVNEPKIQYNAKPYEINGDTPNMFIVPVKAFGGFLSGYGSRVYLDGLQKVSFPWVKADCFAFEVDGFSMYKSKVIDGILYEAGYAPQSYVVGTKLEQLAWMQKGRDYIFQTTEGIIIKTFVKMDEKFCHLKSINEEYNPVAPVPLKSIKVVYHIERTTNKNLK